MSYATIALLTAALGIPLTTATTAPQDKLADLSKEELAASASITKGKVIGTLSFLASDALGGRDTPSPGLDIAAAYVADDMPEIIETARRLIYLFSNEMQLVEDGEIDPTMPMLQRKAQQVAAVRQILSEVEGDDRVESYKVEELRGSVERIIERLRAVAEGLSQ